MKLAEALNLRADLKIRIDRTGSRLEANSKVQEGDVPDEDPEELLRELESLTSQLEELIWRINMTNSSTVSSDGRTLTQMIAHRDVLRTKESILRRLIDRAGDRAGRYSRTEIVIHSTVDVREIRREADALSAEIRRTDMAIQEANWTTELL